MSCSTCQSTATARLYSKITIPNWKDQKDSVFLFFYHFLINNAVHLHMRVISSQSTKLNVYTEKKHALFKRDFVLGEF